MREGRARGRVAGSRQADDGLTELSRPDLAIGNWRAMLRHGWEAGELVAEGEAIANRIEAQMRTGRPQAAPEWIARMEAESLRSLALQKPGRKGKRVGDGGNSVYCPRYPLLSPLSPAAPVIPRSALP